jgi:hypothetical protein
VLPNNEEADHIQILALARFLRVQFVIVSLDAHAFHCDLLPDDAEVATAGDEWLKLHLLLRR